MYLGHRNLQGQVRKCIFVANSFIYFCNYSLRDVLTIIFCHYNLTEKRKCFSPFPFEEGKAFLLPPKSLIYFNKSILSVLTNYILSWHSQRKKENIFLNFLFEEGNAFFLPPKLLLFLQVHFIPEMAANIHICCRINFTENVLKPKVIKILSRLGLTKYCYNAYCQFSQQECTNFM